MASKLYKLPVPGDISGAASVGATLFSQCQSAYGGDKNAASMLVQNGITVISPAIPGSATNWRVPMAAAQAIGSAIGSAMGYAVGGPIGAFVGLAVADLQAIASSITGGMTYNGVQAMDEAPDQYLMHLYAKLMAWDTNSSSFGLGMSTGNPQGWTFNDYLARLRPPSSTKRGSLYCALLQAAGDTYTAPTGNLSLLVDEIGGVIASAPYLLKQGASTAAMVAKAVPLVTPAWWYWAQPTSGGQGTTQGPVGIVDAIRNTWFADMVPPEWAGSSGAGGPSPGLPLLQMKWQGDIIPPKGQTIQSIIKSALLRAPDPLYFSSDLVTLNLENSGGPFGWAHGGGATFFMNYELLVAIPTILGLLCSGASSRSIVSELLLQAHMLSESTGEANSLTPAFRSLLDDYLTLAAIEEAGHTFKGWETVASPGFGHSTPITPLGTLPTGPNTLQSWVNRYLLGHP